MKYIFCVLLICFIENLFCIHHFTKEKIKTVKMAKLAIQNFIKKPGNYLKAVHSTVQTQKLIRSITNISLYDFFFNENFEHGSSDIIILHSLL